MDLSEVRESRVRHPWETARAAAIEHVLRGASVRPQTVLDYGCGDGFTGEHLIAALGSNRLVGFDIHLTDQLCEKKSGGRVRYVNDWSLVGTDPFDLCLLCDVIEHVEDDRALLGSVRERLHDSGRVLITVPAFQALFTKHDRALRHHRRYALNQLERVIVSAGFEPSASGYMFASLLPGRAVEKILESLRSKVDEGDFGIGAWNGSPAVTRTVEAVLNLDNSILLGLAAYGIKLPGLSAWALCKKRP